MLVKITAKIIEALVQGEAGYANPTTSMPYLEQGFFVYKNQ